MLPTVIVKISARSCSTIAAEWPCSFASSYSIRAASRSLISAATSRSPIFIVMPFTAPPTGSGRVNTASAGVSSGFSKVASTVHVTPSPSTAPLMSIAVTGNSVSPVVRLMPGSSCSVYVVIVMLGSFLLFS